MSSTSVKESAPSADGVNVDLDAGYLRFSKGFAYVLCLLTVAVPCGCICSSTNTSDDKSNHANTGNNHEGGSRSNSNNNHENDENIMLQGMIHRNMKLAVPLTRHTACAKRL